MTPTQPPACGKISDERIQRLIDDLQSQVDDLVRNGETYTGARYRDTATALRELLSHRHPAPVADERAEADSLADDLFVAANFHSLEQPPRNNDGETMKRAAMMLLRLSSALSAQPSGALERAEDYGHIQWTPKTALEHYAAGKHFDVVDGYTRILDTGAIASDALKTLSPEYAGQKGLSPPERAPGVDDCSPIDRLASIIHAACKRAATQHEITGEGAWTEQYELMAEAENITDKLLAIAPPSSSPSATADATLRAALEKDAARWRHVLSHGHLEIFDDNGLFVARWTKTRGDVNGIIRARLDAALAGNEGES